jgi:hypothetical protein
MTVQRWSQALPAPRDFFQQKTSDRRSPGIGVSFVSWRSVFSARVSPDLQSRKSRSRVRGRRTFFAYGMAGRLLV